MIAAFFLPGSVLLGGAVFACRVDRVAVWLPAVVRIYPAAVLVVAVLVAWRFNRSRLFFAALVLVIGERALTLGGDMEYGPVIYDAVSLLLPLNFVLFALVRERGFFTGRGLARLGLIMLQPFLIALWYAYSYPAIAEYLGYEFVRLPFRPPPVSQPALLAFGAGSLLFVVRFFRNREAMDHGFFWGLAAVFAALLSPPGIRVTIYFATAGLILTVSVIEAAHTMAFRDELTGLPARRALNEALLKLGSRYAIAMVDIDFFKKFNDRYGHDVGDQVLRMVAVRLARTGGGGRAFRYGGEEFTLLFPGRSVEEALPYLEEARRTVAAAGFNIRGRNRPRVRPRKRPRRGSGRKVAVTISIGVAEPRRGRNRPPEVIKAADKALYRAKNSGRNRVAS